MQAVLSSALERRDSDLVGAVIVVDLAVPGLGQLLAQQTLGVRAEEGVDQPDVQAPRVDAHLPRRLRQVEQIFRERPEDARPPGLGQLDLPATRRHDAAASRDGNDAQVVEAGLEVTPAQIGRRQRDRDLHDVAGPRSLDVERPRRLDRLYLPLDRPEERRSRPPGRPAAALQLERPVRGVGRRDALMEAEGRIAIDGLLEVVDGDDREPRQIVEALDVPGLNPRLAPFAFVEAVAPGVLHHLAEEAILVLANPLGRPAEHPSLEVIGQRVATEDRLEIGRQEIVREFRPGVRTCHGCHPSTSSSFLARRTLRLYTGRHTSAARP